MLFDRKGGILSQRGDAMGEPFRMENEEAKR